MGEVRVLEWRTSGHRLGYVAALVDAASAVGVRVRLVTEERAAHTSEFEAHLLPRRAAFEILPMSLGTAWTRLLALGRCRQAGDPILVPEADRELGTLLVALLTGRLPRRTVVILMRPPRPGVRGAIKRHATRLLAGRAAVWLLESPLSTPSSVTWPPRMRAFARVLLDPVDLIPTSDPSTPPELRELPSDVRILSLVGTISERKHPFELIEAWSRVRAESAILVIAGRVADDIRDNLGNTTSSLRSVRLIDRYLSNAELAGVLDRSTATCSLQDEPISSGVACAAASRGVAILAQKGTLTGDIVEERGLGGVAVLEPDQLGRAIDALLDPCAAVRDSLALPNRSDFGLALVRSMTQ